MVPFSAKTVFIDPEVYAHAKCRERLDRVLPNIVCEDIREYDAAARKNEFQRAPGRHGERGAADAPPVLFTTFDADRRAWYYHWRDEAEEMGGACQTALELNVVDGCVFRCVYCGWGNLLTFYLDIERFLEGVEGIFERYPRQRLYKYSNTTDLPVFEPELHAVAPLVNRFARERDRYLMLFTKSDNVAFLEDLDHRGHTIVSWSLTSDTTSRTLDRLTPPMDARIAAMARIQQAGYRVRTRFSPIVPIVNWQEEYTELIERLFRAVHPDVITLELLAWMDFDELLRNLDPDVLDPVALQEAGQSRDELRGVKWGPFPQTTHERIYQFCIDTIRRISPGTPISFCHGTPATWNALGGGVNMTGTRFICNCGPQSAPGGEVYDEWHPCCAS